MGGCHRQSIAKIIFSSITGRGVKMKRKAGRPKGKSNEGPLPAHTLLDQIKYEMHFTSDGQLCDLLGVSRATISKIRHQINGVSGDFMIKIHKVMGWPIERIEELLS
jgi:hypothetical protein